MTDNAINTYWTTRRVHRGQPLIERLTEFLGNRGYIAGSFAAWACSLAGEPWKPNDIDIFAKSDEDASNLVNDLVHGSDYVLCSQNEIVSSFSASAMNLDKLGIQVVRPSPEWKLFPTDLINSFDLDVCRAVIISPIEILCDINAGEFYGKVLRINNPLRTFKRIMKYQVRGVSFSDHELLKVFRAWDEMPAAKKESWINQAADSTHEQETFDSDFTDDDDWFEAE